MTLLLLCGVSSAWATSYNQVTDASSLKAGDVIVLGCKAEGAVAGAITKEYLSAVKATFTDDGTLTADGALEFTLGGNADAWTLTSDDSTIGAKTAKSMAWDNGTTTWTISIKDGVATITSTTDGYGNIQYNKNNPRFLNYTSGQTSIEIYKKSSKKLLSLAVSGTATRTSYIEGQTFDPTGLVVTGTYNEGEPQQINGGVEWTFSPAILYAGLTSVNVTATIGDVSSKAYTVNGISVSDWTYANMYTSNVTLTTEGGSSAYDAKIVVGNTQYDAIKTGAKGKTGTCVITIPANTKTVHFHAVGWKGETVTLDVNGTSYELVSDDGATSNSPFTLTNDPETDDYFTYLSNGATTITFSAEGRFILFGINTEEADLSISSIGYSTFSTANAVSIPADVQVYGAKINAEGTAMSLIPVEAGTIIKAGEGLIVKGAANYPVTFKKSYAPGSAITGNELVGTADETVGLSKGDAYLLGEKEGAAVFALCDEGTLGTNKAYLPVSSAVKEVLYFEDATGISTIKNAELNIQDAIYNLAGQKVGADYKGIVIRNGKKMLNK